MELIYLVLGFLFQLLILLVFYIKVNKSNLRLQTTLGESVKSISKPIKPYTETVWYEIENHKPMHMMVLAAIDSYDCGWVADYVYWDEQEQCWYKGSGGEADMFYTHWTYLNQLTYPNGEQMYSKTPFPIPHRLILENED